MVRLYFWWGAVTTNQMALFKCSRETESVWIQIQLFNWKMDIIVMAEQLFLSELHLLQSVAALNV